VLGHHTPAFSVDLGNVLGGLRGELACYSRLLAPTLIYELRGLFLGEAVHARFPLTASTFGDSVDSREREMLFDWSQPAIEQAEISAHGNAFELTQLLARVAMIEIDTESGIEIRLD
jgi:hypothetical protein